MLPPGASRAYAEQSARSSVAVIARGATHEPIRAPGSGYRDAAPGLALLETVSLVLLAAVSWAPWFFPVLTLAVLPLVPVFLLARFRSTGRLTARTGLEAPLTFLLLATCLSCVAIVDPRLAVPKILGLGAGAATLIWIGNRVTTPARVRRATDVLIGVSIVLLCVGLVGTEWTTGKLVVLNAILDRLPGLIRGMVPNTPRGGINPNELAGILALILPVTVGQIEPRSFMTGYHRRRSIVAGIVAIGSVLLLIATASRGALAATAIVLTAWATLGTIGRFRAAHERRRTRWLAAFALVVLLTAEAWAAFQIARRAPLIQDGSGSDTLAGRIEVWDRAVAMLRDFPITGIGPGQFDPVFHLLYVPRLFSPDQLVGHAHNVLLAYAVELGVPGAISLCVLVVAFFRACARTLRSNDRHIRVTGASLALGVIAFLGFGLTDAIAPGARAGIALWAILGLGGAVGRVAVQEASLQSGAMNG